MATISCVSLSKTYSTGFLNRTKNLALNDLSLEIEKNAVFGIVGPNGAGKSTLLKILMGFVRPDSGQATINTTSVLTHQCRVNLGYLPEHPSLYAHITLVDHLLFAGKTARLSKKILKDKIPEVLDTVALSKKEANRPLASFSKGMLQRAGLAYTLLSDPEILILDEPMSGLDPLGRQLLLDITREYQNRGATILFCSHILSDVERICTRIGIMKQGQLVATTTPQELSKRHPLSTLVDGKTPLETFFSEKMQPDN